MYFGFQASLPGYCSVKRLEINGLIVLLFMPCQEMYDDKTSNL